MSLKKKNPNNKATVIQTRVNNKQFVQILGLALANVAGSSQRGKLATWLREAALNYRPSTKIGAK